jgi:hypothetical protein
VASASQAIETQHTLAYSAHCDLKLQLREPG